MAERLLEKYRYFWPYFDISKDPHWKRFSGKSYERRLDEERDELAADSRWPGFFPSPIAFVTTTDGEHSALEKVVGASIVNRFPYIVALSFCIEPLSQRHYARSRFIEMLEKGKGVAIQYFEPGPHIDKVMNAIASVPDDDTEKRIAHSNSAVRRAVTNDASVFDDAYMVYEAKLVEPGRDFSGHPIYEQSFTDFGSHRIYYLEIEAIQLRQDIVKGQSQIYWRSLPSFTPTNQFRDDLVEDKHPVIDTKYQKGYSPHYCFPARNTVAFEYDKVVGNMAVKLLPPLAADQVEVDNDRARWPCFFPSSAGMITTLDGKGVPNLMPCGSTTVLVRHPLCIGICVSYAEINVRYAPRGSLRALDETGRFCCGVPFIDEAIIDAIKYAGNISIDQDKNKIANAGLRAELHGPYALLPALPINFLCEVVKVVRLGTHFLYLGEVKSIVVRDDVTPDNPLQWYPYADVVEAEPTGPVE